MFAPDPHVCPRWVQAIFELIADLQGVLCEWFMASTPEPSTIMSPTDLAIQSQRLSDLAAATPQVILARPADFASKSEIFADTRHTREAHLAEAAEFQVTLTHVSRVCYPSV